MRTAALACLILLCVPAAPARSAAWADVSALFAARCVLCHSGPAAPLGLRLDSHEGVIAGSANGAVVTPDDPDGAPLIRRVRGLDRPRMPLTGPPSWLTEAGIGRLRARIAGGARDADGVPAPMPAGARLRLRGIMTGPSEIDGAAFAITGATRIDERPSPGARAELRAHLGPDGRIIADRLRAR